MKAVSARIRRPISSHINRSFLVFATLTAFFVSSCSNSSATCDYSTGLAEFGESPHVAILLDDSSSMELVADEVVEGFNNLIASLPKSATISLYGFGTGENLRIIHERKPVSSLPLLNRRSYFPNGQTPLYDSITNVLSHTESEPTIQKLNPSTLIIISDGAENSSTAYSLGQTQEKIDTAQSLGTNILFFALGSDAAAEARNLGIPETNAREFSPDSDGVGEAFRNIGGGFSQGSASSRCQRLVP